MAKAKNKKAKKVKKKKSHAKKSVPKKAKAAKKKSVAKKQKPVKEKKILKKDIPVKEKKIIPAEEPQQVPEKKEKTQAQIDAAKLKAKQKAIAKAREAIHAREKQKANAFAIDKSAAEKQLKLAEPKNKLILEYIIHASQGLLYEFITSPSGLAEWFADNVNIVGNIYEFFWEGAKQTAKVLAVKENKSIRFQWADRAPNTYFEFRIEKNELTEELSLIITDFAETPDEKNSLEVLWQGQVQRLMNVIGSKV